MKYRLIEEIDEITIITELGGIVCVRETEDQDGRIATADYYHLSLLEIDVEKQEIWNQLSEGTIDCIDYTITPFDHYSVIDEALEWLCPNVTKFELDNSIFSNVDF